MYPEFAIGKLEAAQVSNLQIREMDPMGQQRDPRYEYQFQLKNLSRFSKLGENDQVLLIPIQNRDNISGYERDKWKVTILTKTWDETDNCFDITTDGNCTNNVLHNSDELGIEEPDWYIYPISMGVWAMKLFSGGRAGYNRLLVKNNVGNSWLGKRMAVLLGLYSQTMIQVPEERTFHTQEVYSLAPDLLQQHKREKEDTLLTTVHPAPDPSQRQAIQYAFQTPLRVIRGPPGTGKSKTIIAIIDEFIHRREAMGITENRVLISTFSYSASNVLLDNLCSSVDKDGEPTYAALSQKVYLHSQFQEPYRVQGDENTYHVDYICKVGNGWNFNEATRITPGSQTKLEDLLRTNVVFFANAHQLYHLGCRSTNNQDRFVISHDVFEFDLIIIDEASQYPVDHILSSMQLVRSGTIEIVNIQSESNEMNATHLGNIQIVNPETLQTHVIVVGDNNQLPPVQPIKPPEALESILRSIFDYYVTGFKLGDEQLQYNYRSHYLIVGFIDSLGLYEKSFVPAPHSPYADAIIQGNLELIGEPWTRSILDPKNIVVGLVHDNRFDTSLSMLEARVTTKIIVDLFIMQQLKDAEAQRSFWIDFLGIVAPHNAHSKTITNMLFETLTSSGLNLLPQDELMNYLNNTIYSVEKFQGSERTVIIATIGVSDEDQLKAEEDFIFDRNRLNVLITRARSKMILVCSQNFLDYIPDENERFFDVSIATRFLEYCNDPIDIQVEIDDNEYDLQCYLRSI
jgi:hypothetical protein